VRGLMSRCRPNLQRDMEQPGRCRARRWVTRAIVVTAATIMLTLLGGPAEARHLPGKNGQERPFWLLVREVHRIVWGAPRATDGSGQVTSASSTVAPTTAPVATTTAPVNPQPATRSGVIDSRCAAGLAAVEATGLVLPALFEFRCPGSTELFPGDRQHWGVACAFASLCPRGAYVAVNPAVIGPSDARLRFVIAHEICHARDYVEGRPVSEAAADACAAGHGFPPT
jgi:hypothetical protein